MSVKRIACITTLLLGILSTTTWAQPTRATAQTPEAIRAQERLIAARTPVIRGGNVATDAEILARPWAE